MDSVVEEQIVLTDGRRLDLRVSGPENGDVLVFHHGTPGACTTLRSVERPAHDRGLRVASFSRPGYGHSTRQPGRRVIEAVADTRALLDAVGAERCVVAGWSGGGPHALACAARLEPVDAALTIAAVAPYGVDDLDWMAGMGEENVVEFGATLQGENVLRAYLDGVRPHLQTVTVDEIISSLDSVLPAVDKAVLTDEFGQDMAAAFHRALEVSVDGWLDDDLAFASPWGFDVGDISVPVSIWQGSADLMVPFAHGQWLAARVPGASVHLEEGEGHLSIGIGAIDRMLDELVALAGWP
jgi:pimeloyl-ACP methyl ester carboxylesterase